MVRSSECIPAPYPPYPSESITVVADNLPSALPTTGLTVTERGLHDRDVCPATIPTGE